MPLSLTLVLLGFAIGGDLCLSPAPVHGAAFICFAAFNRLADLRYLNFLLPLRTPTAEEFEHIVTGGGAEAGARQDAEHKAEREVYEREMVGERVRQLPLLLLDQVEHL